MLPPEQFAQTSQKNFHDGPDKVDDVAEAIDPTQ